MFKKYLFIGLFIVSVLVTPSVINAQSADLSADKAGEIARLIAELQRQIAVLKAQLAHLQGNQSGAWCFTFEKNLGVGAGGKQVDALHTALVKEGISISPVPVNTTLSEMEKDKEKSKAIFTEATAAAVSAFQLKYKDEILAPLGLANPTGYVGPATRKVLNRLYGCKNVVPQPSVFITPDVLPKATVGQIYTQFLNAHGFSLPSAELDWSIVDGSLPEGLVLEKQSRIVCPVPPLPTPADWRCPGPDIVIITGRIDNSALFGTYTFTVQATNGIQTARRTYTLVVRGEGQGGNLPPTISGVSGPTTLNVGQTVTWTVQASDPENGPLSYSVIWGDEVTVAPMAGSPATSAVQQTAAFTHSYARTGTYYPKFKVTDNVGQSNSTSLSVVVGQTSPITVITPNGGESWVANSVQPITWRYAGATSATKVDLYLDLFHNLPNSSYAIEPSPSFVLDKNISALSTYNWIVATDIVNNQVPIGTYKVRVCDAGLQTRTNCDSSDNYFTILAQ
ncbi:MAG: hypothetical protein HYT47_02115 [Candidatus Vogelbacteria bacterium]|nr:hypothetical protein [Candidatus Vogelbacteria bacterium]